MAPLMAKPGKPFVVVVGAGECIKLRPKMGHLQPQWKVEDHISQDRMSIVLFLK
jgi:hypothetical protein